MKDALHTSQPKNDRIALTNLFITPLILLVQRIFAPKLRHLAWLSLALAVGVLASGPKAVKADEILQPFLDIVSSIFVLPPGMAAKFAADPVLQYYQLERQSKARQPNLSQVPPRPVLSPDAATQKEKQALQRQHDQLWQGQSRQGSQNQGSQNQGSQNQGSQNQGNQNQGNQNQATPLPHQAGSYAQPYSPPPATRPPPKPHEWVPNLVGKKPTEATESADLNVARSSPFGMRTINPSPLDLNNLNFINTPFNSQDAMRTGYLPTEAPTPPTAATTGQNAADSGLPPLSQRVERQVDDADFLASEPPPAAQIAPPNAAASPDKKARQAGKPVADKAVAGKPVAGKPVADKAVAGKPVAGKPVADKPVAGKPVAGKAKPPLKLAIIVFAADSEQLSQDATLVLTKVAAYIKQHPMVLRLDYAVGENAALSQKRRERIRDFLIRQAIAPDAIAPDEPRLPNADPNQVIIQAVPLGGTPPAG